MSTTILDGLKDNRGLGIHALCPEGNIVYANAIQLEQLGYEKSEYIGHHISEFHLDKIRLSDMLQRLARFERLKNYPVQMRGKNGRKFIIYNSNFYEEVADIKYALCFGSEVEENIYDVFCEHFDFTRFCH